MDVPLEIIAAEILIVFLAGFDDVIQRFQAEFFRLAQFAAQFPVLNAAAQRPDRINERQPASVRATPQPRSKISCACGAR